jgi:hypothetical protein
VLASVEVVPLSEEAKLALDSVEELCPRMKALDGVP